MNKETYNKAISIDNSLGILKELDAMLADSDTDPIREVGDSYINWKDLDPDTYTKLLDTIRGEVNVLIDNLEKEFNEL